MKKLPTKNQNCVQSVHEVPNWQIKQSNPFKIQLTTSWNVMMTNLFSILQVSPNWKSVHEVQEEKFYFADKRVRNVCQKPKCVKRVAKNAKWAKLCTENILRSVQKLLKNWQVYRSDEKCDK